MSSPFELSDPSEDAPARRAPRTLNPAQQRHMEVWAEERVPWIRRGALGSLTSVEEYVDTVLAHFAGKKTRRPCWLGTIKNWIRRDERQRLERLAKSGNDEARLALRDPDAWRVKFDRADRVMRTVQPSSGLIAPANSQNSGTAISLNRRS